MSKPRHGFKPRHDVRVKPRPRQYKLVLLSLQIVKGKLAPQHLKLPRTPVHCYYLGAESGWIITEIEIQVQRSSSTVTAKKHIYLKPD